MFTNSGVGVSPGTGNNVLLPESIDRLYQFFFIVVAFSCLAGTVKYWAMLMGITEGGALRFDIAPLHWRLAGAILALLLPLTALGVWFKNPFGLWGWLLVTFIQYMMHAILPQWYGYNAMHLLYSGSVVLLFAAFQTAFYMREKAHKEMGQANPSPQMQQEQMNSRLGSSNQSLQPQRLQYNRPRK